MSTLLDLRYMLGAALARIFLEYGSDYSMLWFDRNDLQVDDPVNLQEGLAVQIDIRLVREADALPAESDQSA